MKKPVYYIIFTIIFILSFRFYAARFYPLLNSDNAVTVLMIHYFKLPNDLYFWGQDRLGSLIPLLGQIPYKILNLSALSAESVTHYAILLLGFLAFSSFLKSYFYRLIFAVIWFFPPMRMIDVTQFAFGIHYSLLAICCYLFSLSSRDKIRHNPLLLHAVLLTLTITLIATIWVSDMAIVSVFLLLGVQVFYYFKRHKITTAIFRKPHLYYGLAGIAAGYIFIKYAKSIAPEKKVYSTFSNFSEIFQTIQVFFSSIWDLLLFKAHEPFTSVYTYLAIFILVASFFILPKLKANDATKKWALFFFLDAAALFAIIIVSQWTFLNGVPRRYFTCTYIALSFALILVLDNANLKKSNHNFLKVFLTITVLIGGTGTLYNLKYIWPKTLTPMAYVVGEFQQLGQIGLIADYWNSYVTSSTNPHIIKATPHDQTWAVRNYDIVEEVFAQDNIYVIRDMWMETFPDTLQQFGRTLVRDGEEFRIGGCNVCKYRKLE